jgi:hypothetical protein
MGFFFEREMKTIHVQLQNKRKDLIKNMLRKMKRGIKLWEKIPQFCFGAVF